MMAIPTGWQSTSVQGSSPSYIHGTNTLSTDDHTCHGDKKKEMQQRALSSSSGQSTPDLHSPLDHDSLDLERHMTTPKLAEKGPKLAHGQQQDEDPDLVTFDPDDPMENPRNWSLHRRWMVIATVSFYAFLSPLSSSVVAPAIPIISDEFHVTSTVEQSLLLSIYVLANAIGPLFYGPLSEMYGRKAILVSANLLFTVFTVACAVAQSRIQFSVFRFFAGLGGSAPISIAGAVIGDLMNADERGTAIAVYSLGPLLGPALGPIIGGWVVEATHGWRWIFGAISIAAGATSVVGYFLQPETFAPRLLGLKAARMRKQTGNAALHTIYEKKRLSLVQRFEHNLVRPFKLMLTQPIIIVLAVFMMIIFGTMYLVITTFATLFQTVYHESVGISSLNYISIALGYTTAGQVGGRLNDTFYKRLRARSADGKGRPEFKLPVMMLTCWCLPTGLLIYGWSAQHATHWIVPNIGAYLMGLGNTTCFQGMQTYIVDSYTLYSASALAAVVFLRSMAGFTLPLAGPTLYENMGYGWGNTVLALVAAVVGIPAPFLLFRFGPRLRAMSRYAASPDGA